MSDVEMEDSKQRNLYKLVKNKLRDIIQYLKSSDYALSSSTVSNKIILNHLMIYNILRKKYNKTYGVPNKDKRHKFNRLYHWMIAELYNIDCNELYTNELIKSTSLFC